MASHTTAQQQQEQDSANHTLEENDAKDEILYEKVLSHGAGSTGGLMDFCNYSVSYSPIHPVFQPTSHSAQRSAGARTGR